MPTDANRTPPVDARRHLDGRVRAAAGYSFAVEPASFTLAPGESRTLTFTATVEDVTFDVLDQHLPVAVRGDEASGTTATGQRREFGDARTPAVR